MPYVHDSSFVDDGAIIGTDTRIWHFCHISKGAKIGRECVVGQGCFVDRNVTIGDHVKIQNGVSVFRGVHIADHVFLGPHCIFTNVKTPRSAFPRNNPELDYLPTWVRTGASIGANATIRCGIELGKWCLIGSGAVVTKNVLPHAVMVGVPAKQIGWACLCGAVLQKHARKWTCPENNCNREYNADRLRLVKTPPHARAVIELND